MNITKKDIAWGYIGLILVQGINVILLPFILIYLTDKELGLWYTFSSLYGLVMLIDFGFQATISRNVSYIWSGAESIKAKGFVKSNKERKINKKYFLKLLSTIKAIYFYIGFIALILLISLGTIYLYKVTSGEIDMIIVFTSWIFYLTAIIINIMFSFWNATLRGIGAIAEYNKTLVIAKVCQIILSLLLLQLGFGIMGVSFAYLMSVILNRIMLSRYFYKYTNFTRNLKGQIKIKRNKQIFNDLLPNTYKTGIISMANYFVINFPIILSSYFISLEVSGTFGIVNQIVTLVLTISNSFFNSVLPQFNSYRVNNKENLLIKLFKKTIAVNYVINIVLFLGVLFLGEYFLSIITEDKELLPINLLIIVIIYRFLYNNQSLFVSLLSTKNIIPYYKSFIISALLIVVIQLVLLNIYSNLLSIILPILIIQLAYNNWKWPIHVIKDLRR